MSALPQPVTRFRPAHLISELEATLRIGQIATSHGEIAAALDAIAGVVLRVRGARQIAVNGYGVPKFVRSVPIEHAALGIARAVIAAGSREWGRLQLDFEPGSLAVESPVRFTRFIGQQIALLLNRISVAEDAETRKRQVSRLNERIEARKVVPRARGVLARRLRISEREAFRLLARKARQSRRPLSHVARAVIWGYEIPDFMPPRLRQLQPVEVTSGLNSLPQPAEART